MLPCNSASTPDWNDLRFRRRDRRCGSLAAASRQLDVDPDHRRPSAGLEACPTPLFERLRASSHTDG